MSDTIYIGGELVVLTYTGPGEPGAAGRRRWQFTTFRPDGIAVLDDDELATLLDALERKWVAVMTAHSGGCKFIEGVSPCTCGAWRGHESIMRSAIKPGEQRIWMLHGDYENAVGELTDALDKTDAADGLVHLTVDCNNWRIVQTMGSVDLARHALREALDYAVDTYDALRDYVRVDVYGLGPRQ